MKCRKIIFLSEYPDLLKEWDYELNDIDPSSLSYGSSRKVHWICKNGHRWVDSVNHRTLDNRKCPYCNNSKVMPGFNDFESQSPHLLKEWDYQNNIVKPSEIYYKSTKKVSWICEKCGQHFNMSPGDRARGQNCPYCARKKVAKGVNDLETLFPNLAKEWDYEKNRNLLPSDVSAHSDKKVYWLCSHGHSWLAAINTRTQKNISGGCPICSNKRIVAGVNDLATTNPDILKYWDFDKNIINPTEISSGSNKTVFWKCGNGHSFKTKVYLFANSKEKNNCPICRNFKVVSGVNDLATTNPELLSEWDFEKNIVKPEQVHAGSHKKVWWKCSIGHSWEAEICTRAKKGHKCPICSNQKVKPGFNDVGTLYPEIKRYWDYEKNPTKPEDYPGLHSNKKIWFKCEKGHSWNTQIADFTRGTRCPYCSNRKVIRGFNDLFTIAPFLEKEWDFDKNKIDPYNISYGSKKKAWWKCKKGHSWLAVINTRIRGNGCPECAKETQSSLPEKAVYYYVKQVFSDAIENPILEEINKRELDIYIPSLRIGIEYDGVNWHKSIKRDLEKDSLCANASITLIRLREKGCPKYISKSIKINCDRIHSNVLLMEKPINEIFSEIAKITGKSHKISVDVKKDLTFINELYVTYQKENSLAKLSPEIAKEWNYEKNGRLRPEMFANSSNQKVWWKCRYGHEWQAVIGSRTGLHHHNGCPICSGHVVLPGFNDLKSQFPEIAKEWDYEKNGDLKPDKITAFNTKKVGWICSNGHHYDASIRTRTKLNSGCPVCLGLKADKGKNDLQTLFPEIAKEWDYKKNGNLKPSDIKPGSEKKVWWTCPQGHSYQTIPRIRTQKHTGCPYCANLKILKGYNDLESKYPELMKDWDYDKNNKLPSEISCGTNYKAFWNCHVCGFEWQANVSSRTILKTGCPECYRRRMKKNKN